MLYRKIMNYSELPSIAVLAADFPNSNGGMGSDKSIPAAYELKRLADLTAARGGGTVMKTLGDSLIVTYPDAMGAVKGALALSAEEPAKASNGGPQLKPRIGLHLGQASILGGDIIGKAVDGASVLKALAGPGMIAASKEIVQSAIDSGIFSASPLAGSAQHSLPPELAGYLIGAAVQSRRAPAEAGTVSSAPEGSAGLLEEIRKAIIEDTKSAGRRLSVAEAREKYGWYGAEAMEVIASLAEQGILVRGVKHAAGREAEREEGESEASSAGFRPSFSSVQTGDIGKSIEQAVHSIVSEIERSVRSSAERSGAGFDHHELRHAMKREYKESRRMYKAERKARRRGLSTDMNGSDFERYKAELQVRARKLRVGVIPSAITFGFVNAGLWYLYTTQAHSFPWEPLVLIFWGSGILDSILGAFRTSRHVAEAEALPDLDAASTAELKRLNKERESIGKHFINALSIPAALLFLSPLLWAGQTWPLIVSAILAGSFVIHFMSYISTMPGKLKRFFAKAGLPADRKSQAEARRRRDSEPKDLGSYASVYGEAKAAAAAIASSLGSADPSSLAEMKPQLDAYLDQVLLLSKTANELDAIIGEIPMSALASDKAELLAKAKTAGPALKSEYSGSVAEIEKQEDSFKALKEQREIIDLRLRSSVNQLNQLKIDLARARAADREGDAMRGESAISSLRARSEELSKYIEDLRSGQLEAIVDPFAELEREFGEKKPGDVVPKDSP